MTLKPKNPLSKLRKQYKEFRKDGYFSVPSALICTARSAAYRLFRKEEYGDMMCYHFIKFKHPEIYKTMFTRKDNAKLLPLVNDEDELPILREKHKLMQILGGAGRRYFYAPESTEKDFHEFIKSGGDANYILKPDASAGSRGISFLHVDGESLVLESIDRTQKAVSLHDVFSTLVNDNLILEEYIKQHESLNKVFDGCVNTIFIHTAQLPDGRIETAGLKYVEFGCGDSRFVNSGNDLVVGINDDGTLFPFGFLRNKGYRDPSKIYSHPDSGVKFEGFHIPYWDEVIKLAIESAKKIPQLTYIKWDIAITPKGPVIIEGNGMPGGYRNGQTYNLEAKHVGTKKERSEFLQALAFSKSLTPEKINEINNVVAGDWNSCPVESSDAVVVLGSSRAISRVAAAYNVFKDDPNITFILCGGSPSIYPADDSENEMLTEAEYMKQYLLDRGINEDRIIVDNKSDNTKENLYNAIDILKSIHVENVAFISAWFHGRRVKELLSEIAPDQPFKQVCYIPAYGSDTKPDNWYKSIYGIEAIYHEWKYC